MNAFTLFSYHAMGQLNENICRGRENGGEPNEKQRTRRKKEWKKHNDWINQNFMLH
jgi:hypothetical protein